MKVVDTDPAAIEEEDIRQGAFALRFSLFLDSFIYWA